MRAFMAAVSLVAVLAACATLAPGQPASSTRPGPLGIYQCPDHPEIQATWQARCPTCGRALQAVPLFHAAADTMRAADANYPAQGQPWPQNPPYGGQNYYPPSQTSPYGYPSSGQYGQGYPPSQYGYPPSGPYGTPGYPPSSQYGYPPSGQYGSQGYPPGQYGYPPTGQYGGQGYPPANQYGYPPSGQYGGQGYPPGQYGYPPSGQYGSRGYPPTGQYGGQEYPYGYPPSGPYGQEYPPSGQYGGPGYPPSAPGYGYGQGGYTPPTTPAQTEPNNPYAGLLNELNKLFNKRRQQGPQQPE